MASLTAILSGVVAFIKAIPAFQKIVEQFVVLYLHSINQSVGKKAAEISKERDELINQYKKAKNNDERKDIFTKLIINSSK